MKEKLCLNAEKLGKELYIDPKYKLLRNLFVKFSIGAPEEISRSEKPFLKKANLFLNSLSPVGFKVVNNLKEAREFMEEVSSWLAGLKKGNTPIEIEVNNNGDITVNSYKINSSKELFFYCLFSGAPFEAVVPLYFIDDKKAEFFNAGTELTKNLCVPVRELLTFLLQTAIPEEESHIYFDSVPNNFALRGAVERLLTGRETEAEKLMWNSLKGENGHLSQEGAEVASIIGSGLYSELFENHFPNHCKSYDKFKKELLSCAYISSAESEYEEVSFEDAEIKKIQRRGAARRRRRKNWLREAYRALRPLLTSNPDILKKIMDRSGLTFMIYPGKISEGRLVCYRSQLPLYRVKKLIFLGIKDKKKNLII